MNSSYTGSFIGNLEPAVAGRCLNLLMFHFHILVDVLIRGLTKREGLHKRLASWVFEVFRGETVNE